MTRPPTKHVQCGCRACNGRASELHVLRQTKKEAAREIRRLVRSLQESERSRRAYVLAVED
jgi:hypothetical protein